MNKREFIARAADQSGAKTNTVFDVTDFRAKSDGKTLDSEAIQKAINAAEDASGTVLIPAGLHLSPRNSFLEIVGCRTIEIMTLFFKKN
jgi:polygalacturonase